MHDIVTEHAYRADLDKGLLETELACPLSHQDGNADLFRVSVWRGNDPVPLDHVTVSACMYIAATGQTILLSGQTHGASASVTLSPECYLTPSRATLVLQLLHENIRHTVLRVNLTILRSASDVILDPTQVLPDLPALLTQMASLEALTTQAQEDLNAFEADQAALLDNVRTENESLRHTLSQDAELLQQTLSTQAKETLSAFEADASAALSGMKQDADAYLSTIEQNAGTTLSRIEQDADECLSRNEAACQLSAAKANAAAENATQAAALAAEAAPVIVSASKGNIVFLSDSDARPLQSLSLFGRTTQVGTPAPSAPVPMVNAGADGSIAVSIYGKNLIDVSNVTDTVPGVTTTAEGNGFHLEGTATADGSIMVVSPGILPPGTYTLSCRMNGTVSDAAKGINLALFSSNHDPMSVWKTGTLNGRYNKTFTLTETALNARVRIALNAGGVYDVTVSDIQLEANSQATFWESYKDVGSVTAITPNGLPGIPVASGGNYTDSTGQQWLCDEIDFRRGVYVQRLKQMVFDGSSDEEWSLNNGRAQIDLSGLQFPARIDVLPAMLCDHYERKTANQTYSGQIGVSMQGWSDGVTGAMFFRYADTADVSEWRTKLAESPVTCLTALQSPIETPLSDAELTAYAALKTQYPTTTIINDAGAGMKLDYVADTKNYIDQKIAAIAAAALST